MKEELQEFLSAYIKAGKGIGAIFGVFIIAMVTVIGPIALGMFLITFTDGLLHIPIIILAGFAALTGFFGTLEYFS